jgi:dihydrofolate reductase
MRKISGLEFVSLDGIIQAPGGKGEDPFGGFDLEGWVAPHFDDDLGNKMGKQMTPPFDLLLGRKTYDIFAGYWPHQGDDDPFIQSKKYVVTNRAIDSDWEKTIPIKGDVVAEIKKLKQQNDPMLQVHGSSHLIQALLENDLADELWLKIFSATLGKGKRQFSAGTNPAAYKLIKSNMSSSGVIIASYKRDGDVKLGSFYYLSYHI